MPTIETRSVIGRVGNTALFVVRVEAPFLWVRHSVFDANAGIWRHCGAVDEAPVMLHVNDVAPGALLKNTEPHKPERFFLRTGRLQQTEEQFRQSMRDWIAAGRHLAPEHEDFSAEEVAKAYDRP